MRRLVPTPIPLDLLDAYPDLALPDARWVAVGMVTSVDGATAVDGRSRALGGAGDLAAFRALRSLADVVLVGLGTAVAEDYRPAWRPPAGRVADRTARGQAPLPRLAVVTGSGEVPEDLRALGDPAHPPYVVTTSGGAGTARSRVGDRAEVVVVDEEQDGAVAPRSVLRALDARGHRRVVVEGGPTLNNAFVGAGVVDELFVTIAPQLVGGGTGIVGPALPAGAATLVLHELRLHDSELVCRYRLLPVDGR